MFEDLQQNSGIPDGIYYVEPENIPTEFVQDNDLIYFF